MKLASDGLPVQRPVNLGAQSGRRFKASTVQLKEQATIFGRPAWHVRDEIEDVQRGFKTTVDSWYVDVPIRAGCRAPALPPSPLDEPTRVEQSGSARRGFSVLTRRLYLTTPIHSEWVADVTEFQETKLDPALFEIPPDYSEALDAGLTVPDNPANRTKRAWNNMWTALAKFIYA